jgi:hypothetical protein
VVRNWIQRDKRDEGGLNKVSLCVFLCVLCDSAVSVLRGYVHRRGAEDAEEDAEKIKERK